MLQTNISTLPLINGSPTAYENLYTAFRAAEDVKNQIYPDVKTIISLDLQLYAKAIRLQARPDVRNNFVFRAGELHTVFVTLRVLGKMIDGSGLDEAFQVAGIVGIC